MTRLQQTYFRCSLSSPKYFFLFLLPSALALDSRASVSSIGEVSPLEATQPITMASFAHKISKSPIYLMRQFPLSITVEIRGHPSLLRERSKRNIPASSLVLTRNFDYLMFQLMTATFVNATSKQDLKIGPPEVSKTPQMLFSLFSSIFG